MKQYIHLIDGKLMVGEKKPTMWGYVGDPEFKQFDFDFTVWRESLVEVKNLIYSYIPEAYIHQVEADAGIKQIFPPHQVETSEPGRITKIITLKQQQ